MSNSQTLILNAPKTKIVEFANNVDPDEVAHNEPPYIGLHCLPTCLSRLSTMWLGQNFSLKFRRLRFVVCFIGTLMVDLAVSQLLQQSR